MIAVIRKAFVVASVAVSAGCLSPDLLRAGVVQVEKTADGWRLRRDGAPYFAKGACVWGAQARLGELAAAGGNAVRTYTEADARDTLDRASSQGLSVLLGFYVQPARLGMDFDDPQALASMRDRLRSCIETYRDHPALLAWGIGNEVELQRDDPGQRRSVFRGLNDLARLAKQLDPHHPACIVVAGIDAEKARELEADCPDVDIIGINSYASLPGLPDRLAKWGFARPYFVTEWGPAGYWEVIKMPWGAPVEPTSSEKAAQFERAYREGIAADARHCLGSFAFFWGQKQEVTATWFGLFLSSGERVNAQDTLVRLWDGRAGPVRCPEISPIQMPGSRFSPGSTIRASVHASSARPLTLDWRIARESGDKHVGGDGEKAPELFAEGIEKLRAGQAVVRLPMAPGAYRLFVTARDEAGNAATANACFLIEPR